jgi:carbon storage regulator CsrA
MMVITRQVGDSIRIGDAVVQIGKITKQYVKLVIDAPRSTPIVRAELLRNTRPCQPLRHVFEDLRLTSTFRFAGTIS